MKIVENHSIGYLDKVYRLVQTSVLDIIIRI